MRTQADIYRELPSVSELLRHPELLAIQAETGQAVVTEACRSVLSRLREEVSAGSLDHERLSLALAGIHEAIRKEVGRAMRHSLRPVINATGVILHTNLGRAPLAEKALEHIRDAAGTYSNLEYDLESGERGKRDVHVDRLFRKLLADESAEPGSAGRARAPVPTQAILTPTVSTRTGISTIVVNNNAAAVLLALNTLAEGGEVIVSRGELVEIGGSFRIPDVMAKSGATLREVGTTNRTGIADYERAITERTKLLLRVHRSNFEISGFTEQPSLSDLVALAQEHKLPLMEDLGSGALFDLRSVGINEPGVLDRLRLGVHLVTYSGDKLLGGPQAGLISGREDLVQRMRSNSLFRALRVDKLTYSALEATLLAYVKRNYNAIPALKMIHASKAEITQRAEVLVEDLEDKAGGGSSHWRCELVDGESLVGGGSAPSAVLPTTLIAITHKRLSAGELSARLRKSDPPIIVRVEEGRVLLDLRTVFPEQDSAIHVALSKL